MAQNAQSHNQMRSIPHCVKAVFYVFVFDSIGWTIIGLLESGVLPRNLWVCEGELHGVYVVVEDGAFHSAVGGYELLVDVSENHLHLCH